jgi:hypothetical protein
MTPRIKIDTDDQGTLRYMCEAAVPFNGNIIKNKKIKIWVNFTKSVII